MATRKLEGYVQVYREADGTISTGYWLHKEDAAYFGKWNSGEALTLDDGTVLRCANPHKLLANIDLSQLGIEYEEFP